MPRISFHTVCLTLALEISYVSVFQNAETFTGAAYSAAAGDDLPGIGDAAFEFKLNLMLLPLVAGFVYTLSRLILWIVSRYVRRWQARSQTPFS